MPLFKYSALDLTNTVKEGVIEGTDKAMAARKLLQQGLRPVSIRPHAEAKSSLFSIELFQRKKLTRTDIDFFIKQVALLLRAGLSLDAALRVMRQNSTKPAFKEFTGQLERKLKEGKSFSQALDDYPQFTAMHINIVRAGEEGGILPEMLLKMSEYQATFQELKQFVVSASVYPAFMLVIGFLAVLLLVLLILPRFEVLFADMGQQMPWNVAIMMDFAHFVRNHGLVSLVLFLAPPVMFVSWVRSAEGRKTFDRLATTLPLVSGFVRDLETTRIFRTIQVLVENGVHLATALKIGSGVANNREYRRALTKATEALKEGREVGKRLRSEGVLPELAADLLSIGEQSGRVGEVCAEIANHYETELRNRVKRFIALIEPVFILLIAVVAGYVVISMLTVIMSINEIAG